MKWIKILSIYIVFSLFLGFIYIPNRVMADFEPVVSDVHHVPKYPIVGDNVTVYATITDPDGINAVELGYCDEYTCYFNIPMTAL